MSLRLGSRRLVMVAAVIKRTVLSVLIICSLCALKIHPVQAQAPDEAWRSIETEHFRVTFPERLESLARRAGNRAEWAWDQLSEAFIDPPDGMIDLLLTDHADVSNGYARVTPSNRITVYARPPVDALSLGHTDEWLELVILHELAHIVHLDHVNNPVGRVSRAIFGRVAMDWPFFPELATPRWVIEGLATWFESRLTQAGRVHGTFEEMQIRTAILEGRFEDIGQASGRSPIWPSGNRPYAYGSLFFDFLLERYGEERMAIFADAIAGQWVPYRLDAAGRDAFGVSLTDEWEVWKDTLEEDLANLDNRLLEYGAITEAERLTERARWGLHPQVSPDGLWLAHVQSDGRSDSHVRVINLETGASRKVERTNGLGALSWLPDGRILLSQFELDGPYRVYSDLWIFDPEGDPKRVTRGARLTQPSVGQEETAWAIQEGDGTNAIVRVDLVSGEVTPLMEPSIDVHWAYPRPSPDGRWLVVTRWEPNAEHDVVILDAATGRVIDRVTNDRALDTTPSWTPDGKGIVWASDRSGILNILSAVVDSVTGEASEPLIATNLRTGGAYPAVDPQGAWVYFAEYNAEGWDVARAPFANGAGPVAALAADRFDVREAFPVRGSVDGEMKKYSPEATLMPSHWEIAWREPVKAPALATPNGDLRSRQLLGVGLGVGSSGFDIAGRHSWAAVARATTSGGKFEAGASYSFYGLGRPILSVATNQRYEGAGQLLGGDAPDQDTLLVLERKRDVSGSITFPVSKWRYNLALTLGGGLVWEHRELWTTALRESANYSLTRPTGRLTNARVTLNFNSSRTHALQMGTARGVNLFLQGRVKNEMQLPDSLKAVEGMDRSLGEVVGRVRGAIPLWGGGYAAHVLALQASGGIASGPGAGPFQYRLGGASGQLEQLTGLELFGGGFLLFPVRGYPPGSRFGRLAWSATAEYRFPLWFINRGFRVWPLHADRMIGSLFFDAGNAWGPDLSASGFQNALRDPLASLGAEITTEMLGLYRARVRLRVGVALPLTGGGDAVGYVRVGLPF